MNYTLYNKLLQRRLIHPRVGVWYTTDIEEAISMLNACHDYLRALDLDPASCVLWDMENDKEVPLPTKVELS